VRCGRGETAAAAIFGEGKELYIYICIYIEREREEGRIYIDRYKGGGGGARRSRRSSCSSDIWRR